MKILVISDSHNVILDSQLEVLKKHGSFDMLIHCGDKYKDAERFANLLDIKRVSQVPGNCDSIKNKSFIIEEIIEGKKLLITHGHLHNVKTSIVELKLHAEEVNADVAIYGHTHCPQNEVINNILYFNPGSTIFPRCGNETFGILEITKEKIEGHIVSLEK